jgi:hypothetical protein
LTGQLEILVTVGERAADPDSEGPASFVIVDPDGNTLLFDQHVDKPGMPKKPASSD